MCIFKLLCLNRLREYKRLISNLLFPFLFFIVSAGFIGSRLFTILLAFIRKAEGFNAETYCLVVLLLAVYSFFCCFLKIKPLITVKPASIFLFHESRLKKLIYLKYAGITFRQLLLSVFLAFCINGSSLNPGFASIIVSILYSLNSCALLRWKIYHKNKVAWADFVVWLILHLSAVSFWIHPFFFLIPFVIWLFMLYRNLIALTLNIEKYEDEMQFIEKILVAQNYNNTVLLDQYAKEKKIHNLPVRKNMSKLLFHYPLIWKAGTSIYRLSIGFILAGLIFFAISLTICKVELFWSIPFLDQKEFRQILLTGSVFSVFQLTLRSMLLQLDSLLEKARDGLFIPFTKKQIITQFSFIPIMVIAGEEILLALVLHCSIFIILTMCILLTAATVLVFWLDAMHKEIVSKGYFAISMIIFISSLMIAV